MTAAPFRTNKRLKKELRQRMTACSKGERFHIKGVSVRLVGLVSELHGSVCKCCPKRKANR